MTSEIVVRQEGSKWHGYIKGRPDIDEVALTEQLARELVERRRARLGNCGAVTRRFGGLACELVAGHKAPVGTRLQHQSGEGPSQRVWVDVRPEDGAGAIE